MHNPFPHLFDRRIASRATQTMLEVSKPIHSLHRTRIDHYRPNSSTILTTKSVPNENRHSKTPTIQVGTTLSTFITAELLLELPKGYQTKPEGKENRSYNPIHHRHINQVILSSISHRNHRNITDNTDNLVHNPYCKEKKTRETSALSNRTSEPRLIGSLSLRQAL